MSISTRKGDEGETDLLFGCRVKKDYPRIEVVGAVDELNAALGLLRVSAKFEMSQREVPKFQETLITLMGELATPVGSEHRYEERFGGSVNADMVKHLDDLVAELEAMGALKIKGWALPGAAGVMSGAYADLARTVCRRAERAVVGLEGTEEAVPNGEIVKYLNRLSDVLWLLARMEEKGGGEESS
ncbi:cob(I)yrinic acid a,c-diamide adenosyltransferase [Phragmitibacter flavus]|uniref:Corrinoid adenosyltransferase n=1 Tax=Phragmitibacter flavus TaxID=2576071 RepID=A0A5R8K8I1_9BACT|nr:cob(I)yrinic acid a,c-diamide adenosyltransferase [Phragmitibacter flavus]TLD68647.1 cob(I)yrinic acid a,c-diamide adenosyltransferase [Phragmitibacter flavus]